MAVIVDIDQGFIIENFKDSSVSLKFSKLLHISLNFEKFSLQIQFENLPFGSQMIQFAIITFFIFLDPLY
jgi:hypothetical protein